MIASLLFQTCYGFDKVCGRARIICLKSGSVTWIRVRHSRQRIHSFVLTTRKCFMKPFTVILPFIVQLCMSISLHAQVPPDSCLRLLRNRHDSTFVNPDSIKIDSCQWSSSYTQRFAYKFFLIVFQYNVKHRAIFPPDTIIEYRPSDLDSQYQSTIAGFQSLESKYGSIYLRELNPELPDTTTLFKRQMWLRFSSYYNIDSAIQWVLSIPLAVQCLYDDHSGVISPVESQISPAHDVVVTVARGCITLSGDYAKHAHSTVDVYDTIGRLLQHESINSTVESAGKVSFPLVIPSAKTLIVCSSEGWTRLVVRSD